LVYQQWLGRAFLLLSWGWNAAEMNPLFFYQDSGKIVGILQAIFFRQDFS